MTFNRYLSNVWGQAKLRKTRDQISSTLGALGLLAFLIRAPSLLHISPKSPKLLVVPFTDEESKAHRD
jgi:hypothetical protein